MPTAHQLITGITPSDSTVVTLDSEGNPKSHIFDLHWDFGDMEQTGVGKKAIVTFANIPLKHQVNIQITVFNFMEHH